MTQFSRRSMLKGAALPAFGVGFCFFASRAGGGDRNQQHALPKTQTQNHRCPHSAGLVHGPQTHIRIYTDQGIYGQGEARTRQSEPPR